MTEPASRLAAGRVTQRRPTGTAAGRAPAGAGAQGGESATAASAVDKGSRTHARGCESCAAGPGPESQDSGAGLAAGVCACWRGRAPAKATGRRRAARRRQKNVEGEHADPRDCVGRRGYREEWAVSRPRRRPVQWEEEAQTDAEGQGWPSRRVTRVAGRSKRRVASRSEQSRSIFLES